MARTLRQRRVSARPQRIAQRHGNIAQAAPVHAQAPPEQEVQSAGAGILPGAAQPPAPEPAKRSPAHYLWDDCDAQAGVDVAVDVEPDWDVSVQIEPDYPVDRIGFALG